jgi:hypothetical protein
MKKTPKVDSKKF